MPEIYVFGGPNGAGKTTTARKVLPQMLGVSEFVNADVIASACRSTPNRWRAKPDV